MHARTVLSAFGLTLAVSLAVEADELVVAAFRNGAVHRHDGATGEFIARLGSAYAPTGLARGPDGHLYVASGGHEVHQFDGAAGAALGVFASDETALLDHPTGVAFAPDGSLLVGSYVGDRILCFDGTTGAFLDAFVPPRTGGLSGARAIAFEPTGAFAYAVSERNGLVLRFDAESGQFLGSVIGANRPSGPTALAFTPDGDLLVTSPLEDAVRRYDAATGAYLGYFVAPRGGGLDYPWSILFVPEPRLSVAGPDPGRSGEENTIVASGADPGERLALLFSRSSGATRARGCGPIAIDLASPRLAGVVRADSSGVALFARLVPARFTGVSLHFQVLAPDTCRKSDAVRSEFPR